jgi:hypothetical protein
MRIIAIFLDLNVSKRSVENTRVAAVPTGYTTPE